MGMVIGKSEHDENEWPSSGIDPNPKRTYVKPTKEQIEAKERAVIESINKSADGVITVLLKQSEACRIGECMKGVNGFVCCLDEPEPPNTNERFWQAWNSNLKSNNMQSTSSNKIALGVAVVLFLCGLLVSPEFLQSDYISESAAFIIKWSVTAVSGILGIYSAGQWKKKADENAKNFRK